MRISVILFFLSLGLALPLSAQTEPSEATPTGKRTCRIIFPERPNDAPKVAYLFDGKENHEIALPSMNFSEVLTLPRGELFLMMSPTRIVDLENLPTDLPRLRIAENVREFYILVTPDRSNARLPIRMNLVNASDGKLKPGETLWFNLTEDRIVAMLGESKMSVMPKGTTITRDPLPESGYYKAQFAHQRNAEGKFHRITEQMWWHDAESRHLGFIVNSGGRLPKIYFYRDFRM